jgi:hypothetical protein
MAEIFSIAIFFVVILVTAVVFFGWLVFVIVRGIMNGIGTLIHGPRHRIEASNTVLCPTRGCGANNPVDARFCRRCGHGLPAAQRISVRRAAVW